MTNEEIIEYVNEWRECKGLDDDYYETTIENNTISYRLECIVTSKIHWTRECSFAIPEDFSTFEDDEQKDFLKKRLDAKLIEWVYDDESVYKEIGYVLGIDDTNRVVETLSLCNSFLESHDYLKTLL